MYVLSVDEHLPVISQQTNIGTTRETTNYFTRILGKIGLNSAEGMTENSLLEYAAMITIYGKLLCIIVNALIMKLLIGYLNIKFPIKMCTNGNMPSYFRKFW